MCFKPAYFGWDAKISQLFLNDDRQARATPRNAGWTLVAFAAIVVTLACPGAASGLRIGTFDVDATPAIGSPVAYVSATSIEDPLTARGIVLLSDEKPIVLCAVDWLGIGNSGYETWRNRLAQAAGTDPQRVAVHTLHQHDGPRCDFAVEQILADHGLAGKRFDVVFCRDVIDRVAASVEQAALTARPVTHLGTGQAKVEKVASNRRILGPDGKVKIIRWSKSTDPDAIAAPEGTIDPYVKSISFHHDDQTLAVLTYYATHPQSYYGQGGVTSEFVGIARTMRDQALPGALHIHFNGASGNVAAGKYNDGSKEMRPVLAQRLADGMRRSWEAITRVRVSSSDVKWHIVPVQLPAAAYLNHDQILSVLKNDQAAEIDRLKAAKELAWLWRCEAGATIDLSCLTIGDLRIVHMPGELFVEYQLQAQRMLPDAFVCMAAYGDYGPGYIGTERAYGQGGYEVRPGVSRVAPAAERVLLMGLRRLLVTSEFESPNR